MKIKKNIKIASSERELQFCYLKVIEELFELGEACTKQITKPIGAEDRMEHLIEEMGDVLLNVRILAEKLDISSKVKERIESKLNTLILM